MTKPIRCTNCDEEFESFDDLEDHLIERHNVPEESIALTYNQTEGQSRLGQNQQQEVNPSPTIEQASHQAQQLENPMRPLVENPDETRELIDTFFNRWQESRKSGLKHQFRLVLIVAILFLAVLIASSYLTQQQILPGSAYTLLLGTIIGYLLTFLEDFL